MGKKKQRKSGLKTEYTKQVNNNISPKSSTTLPAPAIAFKDSLGFGSRFIDYMQDLQAFQQAASAISIVPQAFRDEASKQIEKLVTDGKVKLIKDPSNSAKNLYTFNFDVTREVIPAMTKQERFSRLLKTLPNTFSGLIINFFENYLYEFFLYLLTKKSELVDNLKHEIKLTDLQDVRSIDELREKMIQSYIENQILSENQFEKFEWLLKRNIKVENFPERNTVYEAILRRNLFTHSRGTVNFRYWEGVKKHKIDLSGIPGFVPDMKVGHQLSFDQEYHRKVTTGFVIFTMILTQYALRHVVKQSIDADTLVLEASYNLIDEANYELAIKLLDSVLNANFEDEVKISEDCRTKLIINLANAHRLNKNIKTAQKYLQGDTWKQKPLYHLAQQVILGNYEIAGKIMKDEVRNELASGDYLNYPLFIGFRETQYFVDAYKAIFQKDQLVQERTVLKEMVGVTYAKFTPEQLAKQPEVIRDMFRNAESK
ncbi:MAG: hypothetical protein EBS06_06690 [Proteobacteria bacterium]|nr:hypothetical protein [Pseudomonadota bacterium]